MARSTKGLYKRNVTWWMTYRDALGTQQFESCRTKVKQEAEQMLTNRRKEAMEGLAPAPHMKPVSLEELLTNYLSFVNTQRGVRTKRIHVTHLKRVLGNPPIHTLTVKGLEDYIATRQSEKVGPATINRELATLKHALTKAVAWKMIRKSVREDLAGVQKLTEPGGRLRYLSGPEEASQLLSKCKGVLYPIVLTALHTGMRKGEILSLTWEAIDLKHGFIRVVESKNGEPRDIPINDTLRETLKGLRTRIDVPWVFHDLDGNRFNDIRHRFDHARARAKLMDFHFHDLRHTFASWLVMKRVPLATVSKLLGHKSLSMSMRYAHLSPEHVSAAVRVLDTKPGKQINATFGKQLFDFAKAEVNNMVEPSGMTLASEGNRKSRQLNEWFFNPPNGKS